jgi:DNA helicase-2/ATP-dependent DNA helicase PcrA
MRDCLNITANHGRTNTGEKTVAREWSQYQKAIFRFVKSGEGNAIVEAVAGSGKTTTIVEALSKAKGSSIFLAFNKAIADELKNRDVNARTFHSLCIQPVIRAKAGRVVEQDKLRKIFRETWTDREFQDFYLPFVCRLVSLGKQNGLDCLRTNSQENWLSIIDHHELELEHEGAQLDIAVAASARLLDLSNSHPKWIDYDDMLYLAVRDGIKLPKFRWIFVDEAQDTNAIQRAILRKLFRKDKEGSRMVAVGDPAQAIYGFRGADADSMNNIAEEFKCTRLPLTVSYRCPQAVINHAKRWVMHIEAAPSAPIGEVRNVGQTWTPDVFGPQDMIVCRTTKPLVALGYTLLKARKPFYIMGRDIGLNLIKLIEKQKARDIKTLSGRLESWMTRETEKAIAKDDQFKADAIQDKYDAIMEIIDSLPENERTIDELISVIDHLFTEKKNATILCTIHRAKGLESETVWWLNSSQCPAPWAKGWQFKQEENLCYVATTRAKSNLILIEERKNS